MADDIDFSSFAGRVSFPRTTADLLSTNHCPACFTPLTSTVCTVCGLDLGHSAAAELYETSVSASAALDRRLAIIGRIRYDTAQAADAHQAAALASAPSAAHPAPTETAPPAHSPAAADNVPVAAPAGITTASPPSAATSPSGSVASVSRRKHSSIQVTLLVVGVSLLSVAAIFFLVYAFINFGIIWRSVIIAAITVAALATASLLRRRNLRATGEGIAVFGVVLVYLDAFALRANDFFGLAAADGLVYWGITVLATSVAFIAWHRMSALRAPSIVGFSAFAPGIGLLVAGLVKGGEFGTRPFLIAAAVAVAGLIHRALPRSAPAAQQTGGATNTERVIILCTTALALISGFFIAFTIAPRSDWSGTIAAAVLVAIATAHLWFLAPSSAAQPARAFAYVFSGLAAVVAASAVSIAALRIGTDAFLVLAPANSAALVALALETIAHRGPATWKRFSTVGAWSAAGVLGIALLAPLVVAFAWTVLLPSVGLTETWRMAPTDDVSVSMMTHPGWSVLSLGIVGVLTAALWSYGKVLRARGPILAWWAAGILVAAVSVPSILWIAVAGWLAIATVAVALLCVRRVRSAIPLAYRIVLAAAAIASGLLAYLISWASPSTWWIASIVVIALLLASRRTVTGNSAKATLLGFAAVLTLAGSFATALHITHMPSGFEPTDVDVTNGLRFAGIAAVLMFGVFAVPLGRIANTADRRVMFWLAGVTSALLLAALSNSLDLLDPTARGALLLPEFVTSVLTNGVFLVAILLWITVPITQTLRPERVAASIVTAPAAYATVAAATKLVPLPELVTALAPVTAALLVAAAAVTLSVVKRTPPLRWALDAGVVLVGLPAVVYAVLGEGEHTWLVLILAAVTVLVLAIDTDGLFSSTSWRRHLGWVSLALATAGLWWRLSSNAVTQVEPYVLPLAGAFLIIAFLLARRPAKDKETPSDGGVAAPAIALGGLLVGILPLAVDAAHGDQLRAVVIGSVSAALMLAGSFAIGQRTAQRWWDSAALAGALGVVVLMTGRAASLPLADVTRDAWIVGGFLLLILAAFGQAVPRSADTARLRGSASQALGLAAMVAVVAAEIPAFRETPIGSIRALGLVFLLSAVHVIAGLLQTPPFTRLVGWVAIAFAGIAAFFAIALEVLDTPELATAPIALALLVTGTMHLRDVAAARSWPWLAPGTLILLVPSLVETFNDQALWRIVGLGVVGVAVIIVAVIRKLQAPFTIAVVVVLIHGIATFLPQLRAAYEFVPWWLWLGIGGALLIAVAVRFEQRRRDMKSVVTKFAELR